jgi:hypothetical protein
LLLAEVEVLFSTEIADGTGVALSFGTTPAVVTGLNELPIEEATDRTGETEELSGCKVEELAASGDAVATDPAFSDADEEEITGTTDMPRVLVRIFPPAV